MGRNPAFAIMDMSQGIVIETAARRRVAQGFRERQLDLLVVVGANLPTRALFTLVSRAIAILRGRPASLVFASTLSEGWTLVDVKRSRLSKHKSSLSGNPIS